MKVYASSIPTSQPVGYLSPEFFSQNIYSIYVIPDDFIQNLCPRNFCSAWWQESKRFSDPGNPESGDVENDRIPGFPYSTDGTLPNI